MIEFNPRNTDHENGNAPIISDKELDAYAHAVLEDYKPELLKEPQPFPYIHFLENYLGLRVEYFDLYSEDENHQILGVTAFETGKIQVFDEDNESVEYEVIPADTIVINSKLVEQGMKEVVRFVGTHEGSHYLLHPDVDFRALRGASIVLCRRDTIENFASKKKIRSTLEWIEHHADYLSAALTMPLDTFLPFVKRILRREGIRNNMITMGHDDDINILAHDLLPDEIREVYGVSKKAARIKLKKCGFVSIPYGFNFAKAGFYY